MQDDKIGEINKNSQGTYMKIVEFTNHNNIMVEFQDDFRYIKNTTYPNFKNGYVKNPYDKTICGIGYIGVGKYQAGNHVKHTQEYQNWTCILRRCYDNNLQNVYPAYYDGCTVCEEWYNFQTFSDWYYNNFYQVGTERMHIDKDILIAGNKIYSPETCIIVPQGLNMLFMNRPNKRGLPNGITKQPNGRYSAKYNNKELGMYNTIEEAYEVYVSEKMLHIRKVAETYKGSIPEKVYSAVINHKFDINLDKNYVTNNI